MGDKPELNLTLPQIEKICKADRARWFEKRLEPDEENNIPEVPSQAGQH